MKSVLMRDEPLPMGSPPVLEHQTPTGNTEVAQRLMVFPFTPPDVNLKEKEAVSSSNDWFTKHDKNKIDELGSLDFYASSGPQSVGVVPKLHNTSAGIEIYKLPPTLTKETFEKTEGPFRPGVTKKFSNKRSGDKIAKFKVGTIAQSGLACCYVSRCSATLLRCRRQLIEPWISRSLRKSGSRPERLAIQSAHKRGLICELW